MMSIKICHLSLHYWDRNLLILCYYLHRVKYFRVLSHDVRLDVCGDMLHRILSVEINDGLRFRLTILKKLYLIYYKKLITCPRHIKSNNSPPDAYSIIIIISFWVSITSYKCIILGWRKYLLKRISRFTFSSNSLFFIVDFCKMFADIFWPIFSCIPTI